MAANNILEVLNPADLSVIEKINLMSPFDIETAITNSAICFNEYKHYSAEQKSKILNQIALALIENKLELSQIITLEQGKPISESLTEVNYSADYFFWASKEALIDRSYELVLENGQKRLVNFIPVGVCAAITPWNFPLAMLARKVSAALAVGCSIVVKPAPDTPLTAIKFLEIINKLNIPKNLVQIICADAEDAAKIFFRRSQVKKISFTGSTLVGKELISKSSNQVKRLTLELGGNAPAIVLDDANIDLAVKEIMYAKFRNAGQACIAVNRILVAKNCYIEFKEKFIEAVKNLNIGIGTNDNIHIGPMINLKQRNRAIDFVKESIANGAKVLLDQNVKYSAEEFFQKGYFFAPVVLEQTNTNNTLWHEEIFAPIAVLYPIECDDSEVIEKMISLANDTKSGLAAYIFSEDEAKIKNVVDSIDFGIIGINDGRISSAYCAFGGVKESGYGIEGGKEGVEEYLVQKVSVGI
jgi:succinate-semialdehyde dehydrogenase/glutarate-semialdehyde dehydrogenase